jgi:nucleoside-diphosphate-sugar epimerase
VTGSSGFVGSHLCNELAGDGARGKSLVGVDRVAPEGSARYRHVRADLRRPRALARALESVQGSPVLHLAAEAEVVIPFADLSALIDTNVAGTLNLLRALEPARLLFASSSAVYGHAGPRPVAPGWEHVNPVGAYGMTKAMGELVCAQWARERSRVALAFRFGNVVGPRCRGLIPYLVGHAVDHPEGHTPARCRGGGRIARDYVPVGHVVKVLRRALLSECEPGSYAAFNIGTGHAMTNGEVAEVVQAVLAREGYRLRIDWKSPLEPGEATRVVLDVGRTVRRFDLEAASSDEVVRAIEEGTRDWLSRQAG